MILLMETRAEASATETALFDIWNESLFPQKLDLTDLTPISFPSCELLLGISYRPPEIYEVQVSHSSDGSPQLFLILPMGVHDPLRQTLVLAWGQVDFSPWRSRRFQGLTKLPGLRRVDKSAIGVSLAVPPACDTTYSDNTWNSMNPALIIYLPFLTRPIQDG